MLAKILSCATIGLEGVIVEVEVDTGPGQPHFIVVGLPDTAVQESRERVRTAIRHSGIRFPLGRVTVNLAPANIRKEGPAYDLPIALGVMSSYGGVLDDLSDALVVGELSLDGSLRPTKGILPMVSVAAREGLKRAFVPCDNADEAALVEGIEIYPVDTLGGLARHLSGEAPIPPYIGKPIEVDDHGAAAAMDFKHVRGQEQVKRGLEVAAAGNHNVLLSGPPGTGKTLLARSMPTILPLLSRPEAIEVTKIYSISGLLPPSQPLMLERPFRSPHHTISYAGLVGGGTYPRPGEITLAHRGVLFLDELPEFGSQSLEILRQPLEDRVVTISRASGAITFPANFVLA
jgi:magnesium chelatase family protein